ncbi:MAG TPA: lipoyl(octanoyl) transferase LipB [Gammaproteobacteria bacterium]|jgi:lipoyl(octanoyl) transferase|nr:lipoyl(octanoyl) transferase LipB [Gammaproteobacteria bacterium]
MRPPVVRHLGQVDYVPTWRAMEEFTLARGPDTPDEIWFLEHPPVFTLGMAGKMEHVLAPGDIPVVHIDRGGQVTYHGPGQLVVYPLVDLKRLKLGVRALVEALENSVIDTLEGYGIQARGRRDAPGVYVDARKVCSIGIRVRRGCSYHGIAFNIAMDLEPFQRINPCGYVGLEMTQVSALGGPDSVRRVAEDLAPALLERLGYNGAPLAARAGA